MELSGWGRYPSIDARITQPNCLNDIFKEIKDNNQVSLIARGLGRSYGDSSLAPKVVNTAYLDDIICFDEETGLLTCFAGVSIADLLRVFVPKGWFLPVTPGTKFVTIGGAVASDVHGKNHHQVGSFSDHVSRIKVVTVTDGIVECSKEINPELFHATCGGMGLTGFILEVTLKLKSVSSAWISESTVKANNLTEALELFEQYQTTTYSVAWIDCLSTGNQLGRSLLMLGEHSNHGELQPGKPNKITIPFDFPSFILNRYSIKTFNALYYKRKSKHLSKREIHYEPFFYPLDSINQWNRIYGKNGFVQYQFVIPKDAGIPGMNTVMKKISDSQQGSFLAVLKAFGQGNKNYLSFPIEGYTLALDFKLSNSVLDLLNELDAIILDHGGRIYLAKDARMSESMFKQSYKDWERFMDVRNRYGADKVFNSIQSQRLGI